MRRMDKLPYAPRTKRSPLQQAKTHERFATYSIALVVGVVGILIFRTIMVASAESFAGQGRIMSAMVPVAQFLVSLTTLALVRYQVSVAVGQIEQAEQTEARLLQLTAAVRALVETLRLPARTLNETRILR